MRLLSILIENNDTVWIYCRTEALAERFLQQCEDEGFREAERVRLPALK